MSILTAAGVVLPHIIREAKNQQVVDSLPEEPLWNVLAPPGGAFSNGNEVEDRANEADLVTRKFNAAKAATNDPQEHDRLTQEHQDTLRSMGVTPITDKGPLETALTPLVSGLPRVTSQDVKEGSNTPIGKAIIGPLGVKALQTDIGSKAGAVLQRVGVGLAEGMTSPAGMVTLGRTGVSEPLKELISGIFGVDMARQLPPLAKELGTALGGGEYEKAAETGLHILTTGVFSREAAKHVIGKPSIARTSREANEQIPDIQTPEAGRLPTQDSTAVELPVPPPVEGAGNPKPAPATFHGSITSPSGKVLETWNLTEDVEGHPKGSTVSRGTLEKLGYEVGEAPKVAEPERPMFHNEAPYLLKSKELGFSSTAKIDGQQLANRLKNKLTPGEYQGLEEQGLGEFLKEKRTPEEVGKWVEENGPKVEVKELSASPSSEVSRQIAEIEHNLDTTYPGWQGKESELITKSRDFTSSYQKLQELRSKAGSEVRSSESATARYTMVNPKPLDKMPGAVDLLVRVPTKGGVEAATELEYVDAEDRAALATAESNAGVKYTSNHYPTEGKNLLAHVRGYMETTPNGKKVFHVFEVQSDWAQAPRESLEAAKNRNELGSYYDNRPVSDGPLLKHYRLALKAAIDHARKNGADAVALSDAETAMLTEGHDRTITPTVHGPPYYNNEAAARASLERLQPQYDYPLTVEESPHGWHVKGEGERNSISQEKGMRLHYDKTLPKIMEELTGDKGKVVDFGEHQNAYEKTSSDPSESDNVRRSDLIFRNADNTPKTSITARQYSLSSAKKSFSLFGSDKAPKPNRQSQTGFVRIPGRSKINAPLNVAADLPDMMPRQQATDVFSEKFGAEKIPVLGGLLGGKGSWADRRPRIALPYDQAIAKWYAEAHGVGPATASALAAKIHNEVNDVFKADIKGDLNVEPAESGMSRKISDVFEGLQRNPNLYRLTPEQKRVFTNVIKPIMERMKALGDKYQLVDPMDQYFMRGTPKDTNSKIAKNFGGGSGVGARKSFQKERMFKTEQEGWDKGFEYGRDVEARIVQGVNDMYRAIADKRLATDPSLGGRTRGRVVADLRLAYPTKSKAEIQRMADSVQQKGTVKGGLAFFGKIFTPEIASTLNREFSAETARHLKVIATANNLLKALSLGYDFGVGQIQLLPTMFNRPDIWAKSQAMAMGSFASPDVFRAYVRNNAEPIQELAKYGSSVGQLAEYMAGGKSISKGLRGASDVVEKKAGTVAGAVSRVVTEPLAQVTDSFNRHFQTALDVAKVEMWKAWRDVTPEKDRAKVIQSIESTLLSGRMESAMVTHQRAVWERVLLNAPSYYRGAVNFIGALGEKGVSGSVARNAMGRFLLGSVAMYYGLGYAIGMDKKKLDERMDPRRSDFMMWTLPNGDRPLEVGMGGVMRSYVRLAGNVVKTSQEHPESWKSLSPEKNPLTRWYRGHAGPVPQGVWTAFSGKDFLGADKDMQGTLANVLPMTSQGGTTKEKALMSTGLQTMPAKSPSAQEISRKLFGVGPDELNVRDSYTLSKEVDKAKYPQTPNEKSRSAEMAMRHNLENQQKLVGTLGKENQEFLKKQKLEVPGYDTKFTVKGQDIHFTDKEKEQFEQGLKVGYEKAVTTLRTEYHDWDTVSQQAKKVRLERILAGVRKRVEGEIIRAKQTQKAR